MRRRTFAFTLVELLVSMTILTLMLVILLQMTNQTSRTWRTGAAKAEQFTEARKAFETMTGRIANATLNTYWDYAYDPNQAAATLVSGKSVFQSSLATDYVRQSDLRFRVVRMSAPDYANAGVLRTTHGIFFQAPFGMVDDGTPDDTKSLGVLNDLLNSWGYFIEVGDTTDRLPTFLSKSMPARYRSRLMEFGQSAEAFSIYKTLVQRLKQNPIPGVVPSRDPVTNSSGKVDVVDDVWFTDPINSLNLPIGSTTRPVRVLAENILALIILPRLTPEDEAARLVTIKDYALLSPNFEYHSKQTSNYSVDPPAPSATTIAQSPQTFGAINPKNQLPPVVQVAMFAIDETSAATLERNESQPHQLDLPVMLQTNSNTPLFDKAANLETSTTQPEGGDLKAFENELIKRHLSYRLFTSNIALKGAKWSTATTK